MYIGLTKWVIWLPICVWREIVQVRCSDQRINRKPDQPWTDSYQRQWGNHVGQVQVWFCLIRKRFQSHNWLQTSWPGNMELLLHIQPLSNWRRKLWTCLELWRWPCFVCWLWMFSWTQMWTWQLPTSTWTVSLGGLLLSAKMEKVPRLSGLGGRSSLISILSQLLWAIPRMLLVDISSWKSYSDIGI